jgi:protein-tyrosine phosphatase
MRGFVDLHCHYIPGIDDGARSVEEGLGILRELKRIGFDRVIATPHMRPGLFDNEKVGLTNAFEAFLPSLGGSDLPEVGLASEHYFDDVVFSRLMSGDCLPYPGGKAVLLEFYEMDFPTSIDRSFVELRLKRKLLPVIAHPERYQAIWKNPDILERMAGVGVAALLDTASLVGKYGKKPRDIAEELLDRNLYHAACSDAHRPADVKEVHAGMKRIEELYGEEEVEFLFHEGPRALLDGRVPE